MARQINDAFAREIARRQHFTALATLPLNDPAESVRELERAMKELGLPGAMVFSNVNGTPLADARLRTAVEEGQRAERRHLHSSRASAPRAAGWRTTG